MVLEGPRRIALHDVETVVPGSGHTAVNVRAVGICGTDLSIFHGSIPVGYPRILGHEIVGVVAAGDLPTGSRVVVDPSVTCGACMLCREGRGNLCTSGWLLGRDRDGGLQETLLVPSSNLHPVSDSVSDTVAPSIQVLSTCVHGQAMAEVGPGISVAVIGLGVTGLMHVQLANAAGAAPIVGISRSATKLALGESMGAVGVAADTPGVDEVVRDITEGGAEIVIECAGAVATLAQAVRIARPGGRILAYGTITDDEGAFPYYQLYYKELAVLSPRAATPNDLEIAVETVAAGTVDLEALVTDRVTLEDAADALVRVGGPDTLKIVVDV
jgi:L-iditol 2-dehydrogenase